ncbi:MAG: hypothetical protein AAB668_02625 [Patescibacteria group bacterium]
MKERDEEIESTEDVQEEEVVPMSGHDTKLALAMRVIASMKEQLENLEHVLSGRAESDNAERYLAHRASSEEGTTGFSDRVIDGVFDGEHMIGEDGRKYLVPPNYASKSKLVEGDLLRLNVSDSGKFIFKQKGPIERNRMMGTLVQDEVSSDWKVVCEGHAYRVLAAAVSFHHGGIGDDAVVLVPKDAPSRWGALENVIKRAEDEWGG